jgi:hypothetical protein
MKAFLIRCRVAGVVMEDSVEKIKETISGYKKLIQILVDHRDEDKVCRVSKKKISEIYGRSYTGTLNKLNYLIRYGLIKKVDKEGFLITEKRLIEDTPLGLLPRILLLVFEYPEVYSSFKKQAELLSVSMADIQTAWGFHSYFFGSKYPDESELLLLENQEIWGEE